MSQKTQGIPIADGYHMPGEYETHQGCIMIWPERPGSWIYGAKDARVAFCNVIAAIARSETVYVAAGNAGMESARAMLFDRQDTYEEAKQCYCYAGNEAGGWRSNVILFLAETDDAWARDVAPTFLIKEDVRAVNWRFNAWGGEVDGLYASWEKDDAFASFFAEKFGFPWYDAAPFVLEGGSIHSDGEGTLMTTEACLLSAGRNPGLSKEEIERKLKQYLGGEKVLWLPRGIYMDETNEHVDNVCAFLRPGEVVLAWTDNEQDPQYELSRKCLEYLSQQRDAKGREIKVHRLPIPDVPVCITEEELQGYSFEEGEDMRETGERLAASYVNFYFSNGAVVMPVFGGENDKSDRRAVEIMKRLCPEREIIPIPARAILVGGGNIHCITQQIPGVGK